jgi:hypothetical protein
MPFDATDKRFATIALIDAMLEFFGPEGQRWTRYANDSGHGQHCLLGAMRRVRRRQGIKSDQLHHTLKRIERRVIGENWGLQRLNDTRRSYDDIRTILLAAREYAMAKMEGRPEQPVCLDRLKEERPMEHHPFGRLTLPFGIEPASWPITTPAAQII